MASRNHGRLKVLLLLGILLVILEIGERAAKAQNLEYLKEFPTVDQVLKAETSDDPKETALLQMTACSELYDLVRILAGDRQYRDLTNNEGALMSAYRAAQTRIATESDKTWPGPQGKWKRFSLGVIDLYFPPTDARFGSHTHLFQKLLSADIRTRLVDELTREGQVHDAFMKQQAEEDAKFKAQSAASPSDIMSPGNVAAFNSVLMTGDSAPARRCLELGHTAMECTTKGFIGMIGALGANLDQSRMKPGLSMTGIYKSAAGPVLTFDSEKVVINSCGTLVGAGHGYAIGPRADQIVLQVESRPQNFILVAGPDGKISGPGIVTIDGQVVVGHSTVYVPASADGTPAHNRTVDVLAPKTERCQIGSFIPSGSTPTVASATQQAVGVFSGQPAGRATTLRRRRAFASVALMPARAG